MIILQLAALQQSLLKDQVEGIHSRCDNYVSILSCFVDEMYESPQILHEESIGDEHEWFDVVLSTGRERAESVADRTGHGISVADIRTPKTQSVSENFPAPRQCH